MDAGSNPVMTTMKKNKSKIDKMHDFLVYNVLLLWPIWFLVIFLFANIIVHGFFKK